MTDMKPYQPRGAGHAPILRRQAAELRAKAAKLQEQLDKTVAAFSDAFRAEDEKQDTATRIANTSRRSRQFGTKS